MRATKNTTSIVGSYFVYCCLVIAIFWAAAAADLFGGKKAHSCPVYPSLYIAIPAQKPQMMPMYRNVWFWREVYPLLRRFCAENNAAFNYVVNLSVEQFLGVCDFEELRLKAKLAGLLREESELRRVCTTMLRSGSYLPSYVQKTLRKPGRPVSLVRSGRVPLKL